MLSSRHVNSSRRVTETKPSFKVFTSLPVRQGCWPSWSFTDTYLRLVAQSRFYCLNRKIWAVPGEIWIPAIFEGFCIGSLLELANHQLAWLMRAICFRYFSPWITREITTQFANASNCVVQCVALRGLQGLIALLQDLKLEVSLGAVTLCCAVPSINMQNAVRCVSPEWGVCGRL